MTAKRSDFPSPMVMGGFKSYRSPVTDELIQSRQEKERDLTRHDCVETQDVKVRPRLKTGGSSDAG
jgi:hypothetical protein